MAVMAEDPRDPDEELIALVDAASDEELGFEDPEDAAAAAEELTEQLDAWSEWAGEA